MLHDLQKRNLTRFFNVYDADNDDYITTEDAETIIRNLAASRNLEVGSTQFDQFRGGFLVYFNQMLGAADQDQDGRVTLDEWLAFHEQMLPQKEMFKQIIMVSAQFMFDLMDANGDGKLRMDEYREWMHAFRIPGEDIVEDVFHRLDLNDNGEVTIQELEQVIYQFYYSDDPDAPGHWAMGRP